jgi:hypothetical protein
MLTELESFGLIKKLSLAAFASEASLKLRLMVNDSVNEKLSIKQENRKFQPEALILLPIDGYQTVIDC